MTVLTLLELEKWCTPPLTGLSPFAAMRTALRFGALARWWLHSEVLARAAAFAPEYQQHWCHQGMPQEIGVCTILFVARQPDKYQLLRPVFLLPVQWQPEKEHDPSLPAGLRALADAVLKELRCYDRLLGRPWGLRMVARCPRLADDLPLSWESAWASLAGGVLLAEAGLRPDPQVWVSSCWTPGEGVQDIDGLARKLELATEEKVAEFFLPAWRVGAARRWLEPRGHQMDLGLLPAGEPNPIKALQPYLARLGLPPGSGEAWDLRRAYYRLQSRGRPKTDDYYWTCLLPTIVQYHRAAMQEKWPDWRPT